MSEIPWKSSLDVLRFVAKESGPAYREHILVGVNEIERLRAALKQILSMPILSDKTPMQQRGEMKEIAKHALQEPHND